MTRVKSPRAVIKSVFRRHFDSTSDLTWSTSLFFKIQFDMPFEKRISSSKKEHRGFSCLDIGMYPSLRSKRTCFGMSNTRNLLGTSS